MDNTESAAATNSAVFGKNISGMRSEENIRSPMARAMNESESKEQL